MGDEALKTCPSEWSLHILTDQRTLTVGGSITVRLVASFTRLHETASLNTNKIIFHSLVSFSLVKLETSCTVMLPPTVSVLWTDYVALLQLSNQFHLVSIIPSVWGKKLIKWMSSEWVDPKQLDVRSWPRPCRWWSNSSSVTRWLDFFQHLAFYINENLPNGIQNLPKLVQDIPR